MTSRNSQKKSVQRVRAGSLSPKQLDHLLVDWANLPDISSATFDDAVQQLLNRYAQFFNEFLAIDSASNGGSEAELDNRTRSIVGMREYIRSAWDSPDSRHRSWYMGAFRFLGQKHTQALQSTRVLGSLGNLAQERSGLPLQAGAREFWDRARFWGQFTEPCPPHNAFEELAFHFLRVSERLRHCPGQDCRTPYFLIMKRGQKYCSARCSAPALREAKRRWWNENRREKER
jgi:hypothetical protein